MKRWSHYQPGASIHWQHLNTLRINEKQTPLINKATTKKHIAIAARRYYHLSTAIHQRFNAHIHVSALCLAYLEHNLIY